ncbi:MAG: hypothetical protein V2I62_11450 [Bacteroidales bacterium]|jgi:hypothetical protein|nr:hypothetical protein [Bacteroidales bacterium]
MKTLLQLAALATFIVALSFSMNATTFNFDPINDIPFNTEEIAAEYLYKQAVAVQFEFEEEKYIDDIPFNTECIVANCLYHEALKVNFELKEESYIDDIPFDTEKTAMKSKYERALNEKFVLTDEPYVDDIPLKLMNLRTQSIELISNELNTLFARVK